MDFTSDWRKAQGTEQAVFDFLSDLRNVGRLMPEQVIDWEADQDRCSFTIKGMTDLHLKIEEKIPNKLVRLIPEGKSPFEFELVSNIRTLEGAAQVKIVLSANLNPMMAMMAKRPLQNLVNIMADKLSVIQF